MSRESQCTCSLRSFWEGPCEWCSAHPEELPPMDYQQYARSILIDMQPVVDRIVTEAAIELGRRAGEELTRVGI